MKSDDATAAIAKHGSQTKAAAALGITRGKLRRLLAKAGPKPAAPAVAAQSRIRGRSLSEFRAQYDLETIVPQRVGAALKALGSTWLYEAEFVKAAGVTTAQLSMFRDRYAAHIVNVKDSRRVWVGSAAVARQMGEML
jgi:hypothetical protein